MGSDKILLIPYLSKELNLIGYSPLPYHFEKKNLKNNTENETPEKVKIIFDKNSMIDALISVCCELVKQIKLTDFNIDSNELDMIKNEKLKLQNRLNLLERKLPKVLKELDAEKEANQQLQIKVQELEVKIKNCEIERKQIVLKNLNNEKLFKNNLKKKESDLETIHKTVWKQFEMVDQNFFPENFKIVKLNQPNFNKLWTEVKYSDCNKKEEALKKAVCQFQENNNILMEDNIIYKSLLFSILEEILEVKKFIKDKLQLNISIISEEREMQIIKTLDRLDVPAYKDIVFKNFNFIKEMLRLVDKASFSISEEIFICWSDVIKNIKIFFID